MAESVTRFGAVDENFSKTITQMEGRLEGFNGSVVATSAKTVASTAAFAAAAAAVAALAAGVAVASGYIAAFRTAMDFAEKIMDLKQRTGELASNLVILQRAFENSGLKADQVGPAIFRLQKVIEDAAAGGGKATEKLNRLGLSFQELQGLSPVEQMEKVAQAIAKIEDPAQRNRELIRLFGQDLGPKMAPLVAQFVEQMQIAEDQLGSFPRIVGQYGPVLDTLKQNLDNLQNTFLKFASGAVGPLADIFANLTERLLNFDAAGFGEKIGLEFRKALVAALIFIEDISRMLGGIWDGMKDTVRPVLAEISGFFRNLAEQVRPQIERISDFFRNLDYRSVGEKIGQQFAYALQVARGLWSDPSQLFGLYGKYLDYTFRMAGDTLITVFATAAQALGRAILGIWASGLPDSIGKILANTFVWATAQLGLKLLSMFDDSMRFFTNIWNSITGQGVASLGQKLLQIVMAFGKDFLTAMTNPVAWITGNLFSNLKAATTQGATAFSVDYDKATGGITQKFRAGLEGMSLQATRNIGQAFGEAGSKILGAVTDAVKKTEGFKSNMMGSEQAAQRLKAHTDTLAESGRKFLASAQQASTLFKTVNTDLKVTANLYTGPTGIAKVTEQSAQKTAAHAKTTETAFRNVATSGDKLRKTVESSGNQFAKQTVQAGRDFSRQVTDSMKRLTDSMRGFATEATLKEAVTQLKTLTKQLPQPVLV